MLFKVLKRLVDGIGTTYVECKYLTASQALIISRMRIAKKMIDFITRKFNHRRLNNILCKNVGLEFLDYKGSNIDKTTTFDIRNGAKCIIGRNVTLRSDINGYHTAMSFPTRIFADASNATIEIGDNCRLNGVSIHAKINISLGSNCVVASGVHILDSDGHVVNSSDRTNWETDIPKKIVIGNNVWIGLNAIVLKGTIIGDNSIVSAGSVVKGEFPSNVIIQGNPAVVYREFNIR